MKLNSNLAVDFSSAGFADAKTFGFEMNAFAFDTVINRIYADKIESPVREYCTNAYDAHLMVGKDEIPFEIAAPSDLNPHFRVRDYGPGMAHEEIMERATTMFASSKRDTNNQVGMIGLGMKSAFALTDAFTITAFRGTTKQVYTCFRDAAGLPTVATLPEEECISPRGIEISFPVKSHQIGRVRTAISKIMLGFEPRPRVVNETWQPTKPAKLLEGEGWHVLSGDLIDRVHVRQGCVLYPVDFDRLNDHGVSWDQQWMPLVIDVPIGSCSVVTSREGLEYDEQTVTYLSARVREVFAAARREVLTGFDKHDDYHEACQAFREAAEIVAKMAGDDLAWRGQRLLRKSFTVSGASRSKARANVVPDRLDKIRFTTGEEKLEPWELQGAVILFEDEMATVPSLRVKRYRQEHPGDTVIWLKDCYTSEALIQLGPLKTIALSTIEPLKSERVSIVRKTVRSDLRAFDEWRSLHRGCDLDDGGYFVMTDGPHYQWRGENGVKFKAIDQGWMRLARRLGLIDKPVYALVAGQRTVPEKHKGWTSLEDRLAAVAATFDAKNWAQQAGYYHFVHSARWGTLLGLDGRAPKRIQRFIDKVKAIQPPEQSHDLRQLWELFGNVAPQRDRSLETQAEKLLEHYPLLEFIGTGDRNADLLTHYLTLLKR